MAIRLRATRKRLVAETETEVHAALTAAEQQADKVGKTALVDFEAVDGSTLSMLVGGAETLLSWRYPGDTEPRFLSLGDPHAEGSVGFSRDFTDRIKAPRWALISRAEALTALNEFIVSNEIPESVQWADFKSPA